MSDQPQLGEIKGIFLGSRDESFKTMVKNVLKRGNLEKKYSSVLLTESALTQYGYALTSDLIDITNNYQYYEQIGDLSVNKFIVAYIYERFPQLRIPDGVKVAARVKINYGSKNSFCKFAEALNFWDFVSATNEQRQTKKKSLLEDTFEAFFGVTEILIDEKFGIGTGYACVYKILKGIFDEIQISLAYEDLYDAKTRLKELFDIHDTKLGLLIYEENKEGIFTVSTAYRLEGASYEVRPDGSVNPKKIMGTYKKISIGHGKAVLKADAQQIAAKHAIETLKIHGYVKFAPKIYSLLAQDRKKAETTQEDVSRVLGGCKINDQLQTRGKSKHHTKYTSTALMKYCREGDYVGIKICLKLGANPNIPDSEGMFCMDRLLMRKITIETEAWIGKIMKRFFNVEPSLCVTDNVFEMYYASLRHPFFEQQLGNLEIHENVTISL